MWKNSRFSANLVKMAEMCSSDRKFLLKVHLPVDRTAVSGRISNCDNFPGSAPVDGASGKVDGLWGKKAFPLPIFLFLL